MLEHPADAHDEAGFDVGGIFRGYSAVHACADSCEHDRVDEAAL
jgi:hypothetical protein